MSRRVDHVIVDRDGVIVVEGDAPVTSTGEWTWIPGAREAVVALGRAGFAVSVATNQSVIGSGVVDGATVAALHEAVRADVASHGGPEVAFFVCPHTADDGCVCRKPAAGLVSDAVRSSGIPAERTLMVGDDRRDLDAAHAAGVTAVLVRTGKGAAVEATVDGDVDVFDDLADVARSLGVDVAVDVGVDVAVDVDPAGLDIVSRSFAAHRSVVDRSMRETAPALRTAAHALVAAVGAGGAVLAFGNGGSATDASHLVAELVGRVRRWRRPIAATAVGTDLATLTAASNDLGYEHALEREVEARARPGDVAVAISTSGRSPNVVLAAEAARRLGCTVIALSGGDGGDLVRHAHIAVLVPSDDVARIQEVHGLCVHVLADAVEEALLDPSARQGDA